MHVMLTIGALDGITLVCLTCQMRNPLK